MRIRNTAILAILSLLTANAAFAVNWYRFKDNNGQTVISHSIPPGMERNGYEVLNQQGQVLEVVPAALSSEEKDEKRRKEIQRAAQREKDRALLRMYSETGDAVRSRDRQLEALHLKIQYNEGAIVSHESKLAELLERAANLERAGRDVDENLQTEIEIVQNQITAARNDITELQQEVKDVTTEFAPIIQRLNEIAAEKQENP